MRQQSKTGYVVKVYPRFSETFVVTEILAREARGEQIAIYALRPTSDPRFHPELARVQAPVTFIAKEHKLGEVWANVAEAERTVPGFAQRFAESLPELAAFEASEVAQGVRLAVESIRANLTHLHAHFGSLAGRVAEVASRLSGIPYSVTLHAKDIFHESVDEQRLGMLIERAHHVVTISRFNLESLRDRYPEHAAKIVLQYNGLELERFPYRAPETTRAPGAPLRIAAVGRLVEKKGFGLLVDAIAQLRDEGVDSEVRIAGDGELEAELAARIAAHGLGARVHLLGSRTQREVGELLRWAEVFVAPSIVGEDGNADGLPTVLLEAMATGTPSIASDVTGMPEVIGRIDGFGETGLLVPAGDRTALVAAIRALAAHPELGLLTRRARRLIEARFDSAAQANSLRRLQHPLPASLVDQRVAYVCADPGVPVFGTKGSSVHVQEVLRALRALGASVQLYCLRRGDHVPADLADLAVTEVPVRGRDDGNREKAVRSAARELAERVAESHPDIVYERYSLWSCALSEVTTATGVPGILEVNSPLIDEQRKHRQLHDEAGARANLRAQLEAAASTVCVSPPVAEWARQTAPEASARIHVVPNGVNTRRITATDAEIVREAPVTVVFVGTLKPWHGVSTLLDAVSLAAPSWRLVIVGDGPERERLLEQASAFPPDTRRRIEFAGAVPPSEVPRFLAAASIAVAPYPAHDGEEGYFSPLKIYEYLASGLPIVASATGQIPSILDDGRTGVLVPPSDPRALASALDALAADPERRTSLSRAARAQAEEHHDWRNVVSKIWRTVA
ncbi:glycosyltransferase family 4 protein [Pseudoclavibacter sp. 8L]|uniref:glycosyltransferase family 4 protein n=1 Tax=Pseudoclavibacter sp. 8L TaxID=2653162 RepID=UPI0012F2C842|nr:glycosyltransferase family 4 protein [Pseudoclavibacter sp. 8L]VXB53895.1 conserved hypothetical protein [Pseudoclavibacter sp. 8L]